jgi:hypothetical protein
VTASSGFLSQSRAKTTAGMQFRQWYFSLTSNRLPTADAGVPDGGFAIRELFWRWCAGRVRALRAIPTETP